MKQISAYFHEDFYKTQKLEGKSLESILGPYSHFIQKHSFLSLINKDLLLKAFCHKSFTHEFPEHPSYERLEFLGDSVLGLIVTRLLFDNFPELPEGELSIFRSKIVREETLDVFSKELGYDKLILLGKGELISKGYEKKSILSDCFESNLGALYLSIGFERTKKILTTYLEPKLKEF